MIEIYYDLDKNSVGSIDLGTLTSAWSAWFDQ